MYPNFNRTLSGNELTSVTFNTSNSHAINFDEQGRIILNSNSIQLVNLSATFCSRSVEKQVFANLDMSGPFDVDIGSSVGRAVDISQPSVTFDVRVHAASNIDKFDVNVVFDTSKVNTDGINFGPSQTFNQLGMRHVIGSFYIKFYTEFPILSHEMTSFSLGTVSLSSTTDVGDITVAFGMVKLADGVDNITSYCLHDDSYLLPEIIGSSDTCRTRTSSVFSGTHYNPVNIAYDSNAMPHIPFKFLNNDLLSILDCEHHAHAVYQTDGVVQTTAFLQGQNPDLVLYYNPTYEYYNGTTTPYINQRGTMFCLNYLSKTQGLLYSYTQSCNGSVSNILFNVTGGHNGTLDQASFYVSTTSTYMTALHVQYICDGVIMSASLNPSQEYLRSCYQFNTSSIATSS